MSFLATEGASTCLSGASTATGTSGMPTNHSCSPCAVSATGSGISGAASSAAKGRPGPCGPGLPWGDNKGKKERLQDWGEGLSVHPSPEPAQ